MSRLIMNALASRTSKATSGVATLATELPSRLAAVPSQISRNVPSLRRPLP